MNRSALVLALHAALILFTGCSLPGGEDGLPKNSVSVKVHGVNYTDLFIGYSVVHLDPKKPWPPGDRVGPFDVGLAVCCFDLPKKWKPGIKLTIHTSYWVKDEKHPDGEDIGRSDIIELPRYPDGEPGDLWVLRTANGGLEVVSSKLRPDHPQWPGRVKGWPEPSLEFRRERWAIFQSEALAAVDDYRQALRKIDKDPESAFKEFWDFDPGRNYEDVKEFSGPNDPRYRSYLKARLTGTLRYWTARVQRNLKEKP